MAYIQDPVAVIGMGCRLPGNSNSPHALWKMLEAGLCAENEPPLSRFDFKTHFDGSRKPKTMRSPGGMFLENIDPAHFDAAFFSTSAADAIAMDPQQRQLLEVVYECLENAGIPLESLSGKSVGCFVGSSSADYSDIQARDPDDCVPGVTVGVSRAIMSNRISHFLNIKGPSMTIDTACSGSLAAVDVACRYLQSKELSSAIVAGANLYFGAEHVMDAGSMLGAFSVSGKCHTWDAKADGYMRAEGINAVMLKRLEDAVRDGDPIHGVIRGTAVTSNGRTPGIASPSSEAQAAAIREAYQHAGITNFNDTTYLECHGTGTSAGDPTELIGAASVFSSPTRSTPLLIGSIKSNIGHSEPAAGISGLLKAILTLQHDTIPGNPTFVTPSPKIDFESLQVQASGSLRPWPEVSLKRASVNSFGFGGSNVHAVIDAFDSPTHVSSYRKTDDYDDFFTDASENESERPYTLVFSANDEGSLRDWVASLSGHLMSPEVSIKLFDLAFTLSERRSKLFNRGYIVSRTISGGLDTSSLVVGKPSTKLPRIGFVFTGQGAQWPQMGKELLQAFPEARAVIERLDKVLQSISNPPKWTLYQELTEDRSPEVLRRPEFSQPLVTALQLAMLHVLKDSWEMTPHAVVGHSSGEIAAAYAAGYLDEANAIKAAFHRGQAANNNPMSDTGMLAVGLGPDLISKYIDDRDDVHVACYNSPDSVTLSGKVSALESVKSALSQDQHFARSLQVDLAYHSSFMNDIGNAYKSTLDQDFQHVTGGKAKTAIWFSSVSGLERDPKDAADSAYWRENMVSPVQFDSAARSMISGETGCDFLIEIGPSGALKGPIGQIKKTLDDEGDSIEYCAALTRGKNSVDAMFGVAGRLFLTGAPIDLGRVNTACESQSSQVPAVIVDLPNYAWSHKTKYWFESDASRDWRYREFPHHDLVGSKVLGTTYDAPVWRKQLSLEELPWLRDHKMGPDIIFPAAGFIAMAIEGIHQITEALSSKDKATIFTNKGFRLRNSTFPRAMVLEEGKKLTVMLTMARAPGVGNPWHDFRVRSKVADVWNEHCKGSIRVEEIWGKKATSEQLAPFQHATKGETWYKAFNEIGYGFGPSFQKVTRTECTSGQPLTRSTVDLTVPESAYPQSSYPMHPTAIDGCLQTCASAVWKGNRSAVDAVLIPAIIEDLTVASPSGNFAEGLAVASSQYAGVGRSELAKNYKGTANVFNPSSGEILLRVRGLRFHQLDVGGTDKPSHVYTKLQWIPDIRLLKQDGMDSWLASNASGESQAVNKILDLVAYKQPSLNVAEICILPGIADSIWLDDISTIRQCCLQFAFISSDATALVDAQEQYKGRGVSKFDLFEAFNPTQQGPRETVLDLVILRVDVTDPELQHHLSAVRPMVAAGGQLMLLYSGDHMAKTEMSLGEVNAWTSNLLAGAGFQPTHHGAGDSGRRFYLATTAAENPPKPGPRHLDVVHAGGIIPELKPVVDGLESLGWKITYRSISDDFSNSDRPLVVLDELVTPIIARITEIQWTALRKLLSSDCPILWVTEGSQMRVTRPEKAMIHGLCRTVRAEDSMSRITTLDVQRSTGQRTISTIDQILVETCGDESTKVDQEFVERDGFVHISRVLPNTAANNVSRERAHGRDFETISLRLSPSTVRLIAERLGTLDSLHFNDVGQPALGENCAEVAIEAAGLNFKDVAIAMGIVPENEHLLGLEGAGTIVRPGSTSYSVGDRVLVVGKGTFANRIIASAEQIRPIPDRMSFEEAASMACVFYTALYSLYNLASTKSGQRVLVHSATGGLGIACIQVCKHLNVEVYATAGSETKRRFLAEHLGVAEGNIFNSRTTEFAERLMDATNQEGVDVIINTLTGELLDETWRCIRFGGTMVELGKGWNGSTLSMEPFGQNATYSCVDMGNNRVPEELRSKLLDQLMSLVDQRILTPIRPMKTFAFDQMQDAFRYMRSATHIGKIVVSMQGQQDVMVQARPLAWSLQLNPEKSYLIVGGLKGLCGSLAVHLARKGARSIVVMARSGHADDISQAVIKSVKSEGAHVQFVVGDVSKEDSVRRAFEESKWPIAGVIQGAMVLRDRMFASMTMEEYTECVKSKLDGTRHLHNLALEKGLDLDFFTMLSSISGVIGQRGQANYAAANVFLDAFAGYRQGLGLRASSVDLGAIQDVGYVARNADLLDTLDPETWTRIDEPKLLDIVEQSIIQQIDPNCSAKLAGESQLISGIAAPLAADSPLVTNDIRFAALQFGSGTGESREDDGTDQELSTFLQLVRSKPTGSSQNQVLNLCVSVLNRQFQKILRLPEPMEPAKDFSSYGLDSLAGVELRNWVRKNISADLMILDITTATSLKSLCEKLVSKIQGTDAA